MVEVSLSGSFLSSLLFKLKNASGDRVSTILDVVTGGARVILPGRAPAGEGVQS